MLVKPRPLAAAINLQNIAAAPARPAGRARGIAPYNRGRYRRRRRVPWPAAPGLAGAAA